MKCHSYFATLVASALLIAVNACEQPEPTTIDVAAQQASLLKADRAFASAVAAEGVDAWVRFFADNGVMFPQGSPAVAGLATGHGVSLSDSPGS